MCHSNNLLHYKNNLLTYIIVSPTLNSRVDELSNLEQIRYKLKFGLELLISIEDTWVKSHQNPSRGKTFTERQNLRDIVPSLYHTCIHGGGPYIPSWDIKLAPIY